MESVTTLIEAIMKNGIPPATVGLRIDETKLKRGENEGAAYEISVQLQDQDGRYHEVKRVVDNDATSITEVPYRFCEIQRLKFRALTGKASSGKDTEMGTAVSSLGKLLSSSPSNIELSDNAGTLTIEAKEITDYRVIEFQVFAEKLDKRDLFGKADPYLQISREEGGKWTVIHKTELVKDSVNPHWNAFALRFNILCNGNPDKEIRFACFDHDRSGASDLIGEVLIAPSKLLQENGGSSFLLTNPKKKSKKKERGSGKLFFEKCAVKRHHSFLDYISAGCQIRLMCGVDFTASNGDSRQNGSLHYTGSTNPNKYVQAIQAIGQIVQDYDRDGMIPSFGFGAKIPPDNRVSHDFCLNFNEDKPECGGVEELIRCYKNTLSTVKLWGPTNVSPIIKRVAECAAKHAETASQYSVLLILIDGVITDIVETKQAIAQSSNLPMSVMFVGIGNADFTPMEIFNGGVKELKMHENEEVAQRNNVQFVAARKFRFRASSSLARDVLEKIPIQVLEYFEMKKLAPAESQGRSVNVENHAEETQSHSKEEKEYATDPKNEEDDSERQHLQVEINGHHYEDIPEREQEHVSVM